MIFERFVRDRLGHEAGARAARRGRHRTSAASRSTRAISTSSSTTASTSARPCTRARAYPGEHEAIIAPDALGQGPRHPAESPTEAGRADAGADAGAAEGPDLRPDRAGDDADPHAQAAGSCTAITSPRAVLKQRRGACPVGRVPAGEIEAAVIDQVRGLLRTPEIIVADMARGAGQMPDITEADVREALHRLDPLWDELFPAEQARIVQLLVERVDV